MPRLVKEVVVDAPIIIKRETAIDILFVKMTDEADSYDRIERWSQEHISAGSDFLFDPKLFQKALEEVCSEHQFKFEVSDERVI